MQKLLLAFIFCSLFVNTKLSENSVDDSRAYQRYVRRIRDRTRTTKRIVVIEAPTPYPPYLYKIPECRDYNEIWSDHCELYCQYQRVESDYYDDRRCRRSVSDVLEEYYVNETSLESNSVLNTWNRIERKKKKKDKVEILVELIEEEKQPINSFQSKRCVCKRNFARLDGRCVALGQCPGKLCLTVSFQICFIVN